MTLYLVANLHFDPHIDDKLPRILASLAPEIIFSETSNQHQSLHAKTERSMRQIALNRFPSIEPLIAEYFSVGNREISLAKAYADSVGIPQVYIDHPNADQKITEKFASQVSLMRTRGKEELEHLFSAAAGSDVAELARQSSWQVLLAKEDTPELEALLDQFSDYGIGRRDEYMAKKIRERYTGHGTAVAIVGQLHAVSSLSGRTLYSKIKDLDPVRISLQEWSP